MKKTVWSAAMTAAAVVMFSGTAYAQENVKTLTVNATVAAKARLTLGAATITFPDTDPDVQGTLTAAPLTIDAKFRVAKDTQMALTVVASGDLAAPGGATIPIGNLKWTSGSTGFSAAGTVTAAPTSATVGTWTNSGDKSGSQTYTLVNDWAYAVGDYSVTLTYTLATP
jgi:hypothetical protein